MFLFDDENKKNKNKCFTLLTKIEKCQVMLT